jgi:preprotein translocase subunit SecE
MKKTVHKRKKRRTRKNVSPPKSSTVSNSNDRANGEEKEIRWKSPQVISKKEPERRVAGNNPIFNYVSIAGQFLRESKMELKKVKWPTRKELLASTAMVIFLVLVLSFFLGLIDFGLIKIIKNIAG